MRAYSASPDPMAGGERQELHTALALWASPLTQNRRLDGLGPSMVIADGEH